MEKNFDFLKLKTTSFLKKNSQTIIFKADFSTVSFDDPNDKILKIAKHLNGLYSFEELYSNIKIEIDNMSKGELVDIITNIFFEEDLVFNSNSFSNLSYYEINKFSRILNYFSSYKDCDQTVAQLFLKRLMSSHVLILGMGGTGSHLAHSLAASGIGELSIVDFDFIELSNVTRQMLYTESDIGLYKVDVAYEKLKKINPTLKINKFYKKISSEEDLKEIFQTLKNISIVVISMDTPRGEIRYIVDNFLYDLNLPYIYCGSTMSKVSCGPMIKKEKTKSYSKLVPINNSLTSLVKDTLNSVFLSSVIEPLNGITGQLTAYEIIKYLTNHSSVQVFSKIISLELDNMDLKITNLEELDLK